MRYGFRGYSLTAAIGAAALSLITASGVVRADDGGTDDGGTDDGGTDDGGAPPDLVDPPDVAMPFDGGVPTEQTTPHNVEVRGWALCLDEANTAGAVWYPMTGARVTVMDSDVVGPSTIFDEDLGHDYVREDGSFSVTGIGGDWGGGWSSPPDVYVRVDYSADRGDPVNHQATLLDDWGVVHSVDTKGAVLNNVSGLIDLGRGSITRATSRLSTSSRCAVWYHAQNAFSEYNAWVGSTPGLVRLRWSRDTRSGTGVGSTMGRPSLHATEPTGCATTPPGAQPRCRRLTRRPARVVVGWSVPNSPKSCASNSMDQRPSGITT